MTSPDHRVDAVLLEDNGGATVSFGYSIYLVPIRGEVHVEDKVAYLYAAGRSEHAYGVNLKWQGSETLRIEFLKARRRLYLCHQAQVAGNSIRILLVDGINDPTAPQGGMLDNVGK